MNSTTPTGIRAKSPRTPPTTDSAIPARKRRTPPRSIQLPDGTQPGRSAIVVVATPVGFSATVGVLVMRDSHSIGK